MSVKPDTRAAMSISQLAPERALRRLELTVVRRLEGYLHGEHLGLLPGPGTELAEAREYQVGDDVRRMDWAVTARTTVPHVRDLIADRELDTRRRRVRQDFAAAALAQRERTRASLRRVGAGHLVLRTDRDWVADTVRFVLGYRRVAARLHQPPKGVTR